MAGDADQLVFLTLPEWAVKQFGTWAADESSRLLALGQMRLHRQWLQVACTCDVAAITGPRSGSSPIVQTMTAGYVRIANWASDQRQDCGEDKAPGRCPRCERLLSRDETCDCSSPAD